MAGIVRSAGTVYVDIALGNTDQVKADAQALKLEVDKILNEPGNTVSAQTANGSSAGSAYKSAFIKDSTGLTDSIDKSLAGTSTTSSSHGSSAGDSYSKAFTGKVSGITSSINSALKDTEASSGSSGSRSGSGWYSNFAGFFQKLKAGAESGLADVEKASGDSGGRAGNSFGSSFFNSASGWFKKIQSLDTGMLGSIGALLPLGVSGGAGVLGGAAAVGSSLVSPAIGLGAGSALMKSYVSAASPAAATISNSQQGQPQIAADIAAQAAGIDRTTKAYATQQAALAALTPTQQSLIAALGQTNLSYTSLSPAEQQQLANISSGTAGYKALLPAQKQAVASLVAQQQAYNSVDPAAQGFIGGLVNIKSSLQGMQDAQAPVYLKAFNSLMDAGQKVITLMQPILHSTGLAFQSLGQSIDQGVGGPVFAAFLAKVNEQIQGGSIQKLVDSLGRLGEGFVILWTKFGGSGHFLDELTKISEEFKNWASGGASGFQTFLDYIKQNGDKLGQLIVSIANAIGALGPGIAGVGSAELSILSGFFKMLSALPPSIAASVGAIVTSLLAFQKLQGFTVIKSLTDFFSSAEGEASNASKLASAIGTVTTATVGAISAAVKWIATTITEIVTMDTEALAAKADAIGEALATAAQWAWNFAMDAFPVVAIIAALVLLVGVIIKYHTQIWNFIVKIWNDIWSFLKNWWYVIILAVVTGGLGLIVGLVIKYHNQIWSFITGIWGQIESFFKSIWASIAAFFTGAWNAFYNDIHNLWTNVKNDAIAAWNYFYNTILMGTWHSIVNFFTGAWSSFRNDMNSLWTNVKNDALGAWNWLYNQVTGTAKNIWHDTVSFLGNMANDIANVFVSIANTGFINPVNTIVNDTIGEGSNPGGLLGALNTVLKFLRITEVSGIPKIPNISHFASGGHVPGNLGEADNSDSIHAMLTPGEFVVRKRAAQKLGPEFLEAINSADKVSHFATGGSVGSVVSGAAVTTALAGAAAATGSAGSQVQNSSASNSPSFWQQLAAPFVAAYDWAKGLALGALVDVTKPILDGIVNALPSGSGIMGLPRSIGTWAENGILGWLGAQDKAAQAASTSTAGTNTPGNVASWISQGMSIAGVSGTDWSSGLSIIAMGESGGNPNVVNTTDSNAQAGTPSAGLMQFIQPTFASYAKPGYTTWMDPIDQVVADAWSGGYIDSRYGGIDNVPGVKSVRAGGSYVGYDSGGILSPGVTATYNGLGQPEAILTPDQWNTMARLASDGGSPEIHVYIGNEEITDHIDVRVMNGMNALSTALGNGRI